MKRFTILLVFSLLALVSFQQQAVALEGGVIASSLEGGVIARSTDGQLYYFNLNSGTSVRVSSDDLNVQSPFAVSKNGRTVVWTTNDGRFHRAIIMYGKAHTLQARYSRINGQVEMKSSEFNLLTDPEFTIGQQFKSPYVTNLTLSPNGTKCTFETIIEADVGFQLIPAGHQLHQSWANHVRQTGFGQKDSHLPMCHRYSPGKSFHGVVVTEITERNFINMYFRCGNTYEYPPTPRYRPSDFFTSYNPGVIRTYTWTEAALMSNINQGMSWNVADHCARYSRERNAYHATWSKDGTMLAVIYKTTITPQANSSGQQPMPITVCGPIEIRLFPKKFNRGEKIIPTKPCIYEIVANMPSCEGLAWKPDGSLTVRSGGSIYQIPADQLTEGISNGTITPAKRTREYAEAYSDDYGIKYIVGNNVFSVKTVKLPHENVEGTRLSWVSNYEFIIREIDNGLWLHTMHPQNGVGVEEYPVTRKNLQPNIPETFFYCNIPSNDIDMLIASRNRPVVPNQIESSTGADRVPSPEGAREVVGYTEVGPFKIFWSHSGGINGTPVLSIMGSFADGRRGEMMGCSIPKGIKSIDAITDPTIFTYKDFKNCIDSFLRMDTFIKEGDIIIFRHEYSYVAFQVGEFDHTGLSFRWKYWPDAKNRVEVASLTSSN